LISFWFTKSSRERILIADLLIVKNAARLAVYVATNIVPVIHQTAAITLPKIKIVGDEN
jgi:hypothetical protein